MVKTSLEQMGGTQFVTDNFTGKSSPRENFSNTLQYIHFSRENLSTLALGYRLKKYTKFFTYSALAIKKFLSEKQQLNQLCAFGKCICLWDIFDLFPKIRVSFFMWSRKLIRDLWFTRHYIRIGATLSEDDTWVHSINSRYLILFFFYFTGMSCKFKIRIKSLW